MIRVRPGPQGVPLLAAAGAATLLAACLPQQAPAQDTAVVSGVTTHFAQGWPPRLLPQAKVLGAGMIRDSVHWPAVERAPGLYAFTPVNSGHVDRACAAGLKVMLGLEPRNPLYDGGNTVWSAPAQLAFARYVAVVAGRWPGCVVAIEIGNEINGKGGMTGPAARDRIGTHVALLRAVRLAAKPDHPHLALLGGSTNALPVGFLTRLFRAGALDAVDGIAVHPYRAQPEGVERELARLSAAMTAAGRTVPVWVTEFSRAFARPEEAASFYLKMIALMEGAGVRRHLWYALADQPGFAALGLVRFDGTEKPAGRAFGFAARTLAPAGPAERVDHGDPTLYDYRFGSAVRVVWGARRPMDAQPTGPEPVRYYRADGTEIAALTSVQDEPVVITGVRTLRFGPTEVIADSLYGFAQAPLSWSAQSTGGASIPLAWVDWQWNGYLGAASQPRAAVTPLGMAVAPGFDTIVRWTSPARTVVFASACLAAQPGESSPVRIAIAHAGRAAWSSTLSGGLGTAMVRLPVEPGDTVDLVTAAGGGPPTRIAYRWRIATSGDEPAPCPSLPGMETPQP